MNITVSSEAIDLQNNSSILVPLITATAVISSGSISPDKITLEKIRCSKNSAFGMIYYASGSSTPADI